MKNKRGIAFAGGGVKSVAQIALIDWLEKNHAHVDVVSGTSAGAFIAALFAMGLSSKEILMEIEEALLTIEQENLMHISATKLIFNRSVAHGVIDGLWLEKIIDNICKKYGVKHISDVKTPLAITAVDLYTGELIVFVSHPHLYSSTHRRTKVISDVSLSKAIRASMSFPLIFGSVSFEDKSLIDGGVRMNCPIPMLKDYGCDVTLGITMRGDIDSEKEITKKLDVANRVFELMSREAEFRHISKADLIFNVPLPSVNIFDTEITQKIYEYGLKEATLKNDDLLAFFKPKSFLQKIFG